MNRAAISFPQAILALAFLSIGEPVYAQQVLGGFNLPGKPPATSIGNESQYYWDFNSGAIYGPKTLGQWPANAVGGFARSGANADITSLSGLTTPLSVSQGGTGLSNFSTTGGVIYGTGSAIAQAPNIKITNNTLSSFYYATPGNTTTLSGSTIPTLLGAFNQNLAGSSTVTGTTWGATVKIGGAGDSASTAGSWDDLLIARNFGGATFAGQRFGNLVQYFWNTASTSGGTLVGSETKMISSVNAGGSATGFGTSNVGQGQLYGSNYWCQLTTGATYFNVCVGNETNVSVQTGASVAFLALEQLIVTADHATHGTVNDAGFIISEQVGATAQLRNIFEIGTYTSQWPVDQNGYLIQAQSGQNHSTNPTTAAGGLDLLQVDFTGTGPTGGGFSFRANGTQIDNSGGYQIGYGYLSSNASGLSLSVPEQTLTGTPTIATAGSGFAVGDLASDSLGDIIQITSVSSGMVTGLSVNRRAWTKSPPTNPVTFIALSQTGASYGSGLALNETWAGQSTLSLQASGSGSVVIGTGTDALQLGSAAMFTATGSTTACVGSLGPSGIHSTVQKWLTLKDNSGVIGYVPVC